MMNQKIQEIQEREERDIVRKERSGCERSFDSAF